MLKNFSGNYNISSDGAEFICPSVYLDHDPKRHMSVNLLSGLWQCFKTGEKGNFVRLYSKIEGISYFDALIRITTNNLDYISFEEPEISHESIANSYDFPSEEFAKIRYDFADTDEPDVVRAWGYLVSRGLFDIEQPERFTYYYARSGRYAGRVIIPYYYDDTCFFFQARTITDQRPKYLIPKNSNAAHVLYPFDEDEDYVVLCEGILDAISLQIQGVNATASTGASITAGQMEILRSFGGRIIAGFDNDEAGQEGVKRLDNLRKYMRMPAIYYVNPPAGKDWNEAAIKGENLQLRIAEGSRKYDSFELAVTEL